MFEDRELTVVNKPAGVLSQGGEGGAGVNLVDLAREHYRRDGIGVLHRLDRNVSGLVMLARAKNAARTLSEALAKGQIERQYRAMAKGRAPDDRFEIDAWLRKDRERNEVTARDRIAPQQPPLGFEEALTRVEVKSRLVLAGKPSVELRLWPVTGRSHQLRVHLAHVGLPIWGDPKYGVALPGINRPLLHASGLAFVHPTSGESLELSAPVPWRLARGQIVLVS